MQTTASNVWTAEEKQGAKTGGKKWNEFTHLTQYGGVAARRTGRKIIGSEATTVSAGGSSSTLNPVEGITAHLNARHHRRNAANIFKAAHRHNNAYLQTLKTAETVRVMTEDYTSRQVRMSSDEPHLIPARWNQKKLETIAC